MVFQFFIWKQNRSYRKPRKPWKESLNSDTLESDLMAWAESWEANDMSPYFLRSPRTPQFSPCFHLAQGEYILLPAPS